MYCSFQENQSGSNRDPVGIPSLDTNCALFGACWEAAKPFKKTTTFLQGFGTYEPPPSRQRMNAGEQYATPAAGKPQPKRELRKPQQPQNQKARKTPNQPPPRASHPKHWRNPLQAAEPQKARMNEPITRHLGKWRPMAAEYKTTSQTTSQAITWKDEQVPTTSAAGCT